MIISNSHKFIFIHIIKTAGTSITYSMNDSIEWNDLVLGSTKFGEEIQNFYRARFNLYKHSTAIETRKQVGDDIWNEYFTFTFVRHPYSRALSFYSYIKRMVQARGITKNDLDSLRNMQQDPVTNWPWPAIFHYLESDNFTEFIQKKNIRPQSEWILDEDENIMVDFIGTVENINKDMTMVAEKIDVNLPPLEMYNQSGSESIDLSFMDENDYEYLYQEFKKDFEILNYDPDFRF